MTPAFAEFESKNGASNQGKGETYETVLEAGGATVTCEALEEGGSKAGWTVENKEGKPKKGLALLVKVTNWGKCQAKAKGLKEAGAVVGALASEVSNIVTEVSKECGSVGIEASKVGALFTDGEFYSVQNAAPRLEFDKGGSVLDR